MDAYIKLLESHNGRDEIVRLCTYASMFVSGAFKGQSSQRLLRFSSELSKARTTLRLFDDLPSMLSLLGYGTGKHESSKSVGMLNCLGNAATQLFYPCDHLSLLGRSGILPVSADFWSYLCTAFWGVYLVAKIAKCIIEIQRLRAMKAEQTKVKPLYTKENDSHILLLPRSEEVTEMLLLAQHTADLLNCINWLPPGFLWAGKFPPALTGLYGIVSTSIMIFNVLRTGL